MADEKQKQAKLKALGQFRKKNGDDGLEEDEEWAEPPPRMIPEYPGSTHMIPEYPPEQREKRKKTEEDEYAEPPPRLIPEYPGSKRMLYEYPPEQREKKKKQ